MSEILKRPAPPDLEFVTPDCTVCGHATDTDGDSFWCEDCDVNWNISGGGGDWVDNGPGCPSTVEWFNTDHLAPEHESIRHVRTRCILGEGHATKHRDFDDWTTWGDDDPRVVVTWEGEAR